MCSLRKKKIKYGALVRQEVRAFLSTYFRTALLRLPLPGFPQQPHQLSCLTGQGERGASSQRGSFQRWKLSACPPGKLQRDGRGVADPHGRANHYTAKLRIPERPNPMFLQANPFPWRPPKCRTQTDYPLASSAAFPGKEEFSDNKGG